MLIVLALVASFSVLNAETDCNMTGYDLADDVQAFEDCQDDLIALGGGEIFLPCGEYTIASTTGYPRSSYVGWTIDSGVKVVGASSGCVMINNQTLGTSQRVVGTGWLDGRPVTDSGLAHVTLRGNRPVSGCGTNFQAHGLMLSNASRFTVEDVRTENIGGDSFYVHVNVDNVSFKGLRADDFCRDGLVINGGSPVTTTRNIVIDDFESYPAKPAPFGYSIDVETGVENLVIVNSHVREVHLAGAHDSLFANSTVTRSVKSGSSDGLTISGVTFLGEEDVAELLTSAHDLRLTVKDSTFYVPSTRKGIYYYSGVSDFGTTLSSNTFLCPTLDCYAAQHTNGHGDLFTSNWNKVLDGFDYGFLDEAGGSSSYIGNQIMADVWCMSMGSANGIQGKLTVALNEFHTCTSGLITWTYNTQDFDIIDHMNGTNP